MSRLFPARVLISGGKPLGGVNSFAQALACGFGELGVPAEVVAPSKALLNPVELRDPTVLKILSLSSVYAAPLARRTLCVSHGVPCAGHQGWPKMLAVLASLRLATAGCGTQLVAVSDYTAQHLRAIFGLRVDAVIRNPLQPLFFNDAEQIEIEREAITFVGRLHSSKNVSRLLPAMRDVLDENPGLKAWIIGDGPMLVPLRRIVGNDRRILLLGPLDSIQVRERLRRTRVFISGSPTEPFGIAYLEALSQGCAVAMPGSGGGLEIAPEQIGHDIFLFPSSIEREGVAVALRAGLTASSTGVKLDAYRARSVAEAYIEIDRRFDSRGEFSSEAQQ